jgi:hypothetical protein
MSRHRERVVTTPATTPVAAASRTRASVLRRLQQTAGNRAVGRVLARDGYQLQTPWLLGGQPAHPRIFDQRLTLDPDLERRYLSELLAPVRLLDHLKALQIPDPAAPAAPPPAPSQRQPNQPAPPEPAEPPGWEKPPEKGDVGKVLGALGEVPEVKRWLGNVQYQVWGRLSSGDRSTLLTTGLTFGIASLGGVLATPGGRALLGRLSGTPLPVPKVPWLAFEFSTENGLIGLGAHVDVGALLPSRFGFGAAGPRDSRQPLYAPPGGGP